MLPVSSLPISVTENDHMFSKWYSSHSSDNLDEMNHLPYRNLIQCLYFVASRMKLDIMYALNVFSQIHANLAVKRYWHGLLKICKTLHFTS